MDSQNDEQNQEPLSSCPTFSSYSNNNNLASIALRVADEFPGEVDQILIEDNNNNNDDDDDFEFSIERDDPSVYPIFSRDNVDKSCSSSDDVIDFEIGVPLRRLLIEEEREQRRDVVDSSSSEEDEEIANIPAGTYCMWKPKKAAAKDLSSTNMCNIKSNSTGSTSSKRWKIMDLLRRSNSEGNGNYLYLAPKPERFSEKIDHQRRRPPQGRKTQALVTVPRRAGGSNARVKKSTTAAVPSAHETFYVRNRAIKESEKRKSYMPKVMVGVFANVNAFTRTYPPF